HLPAPPDSFTLSLHDALPIFDPEASHTDAQKVLHASSHFQLLPDILAERPNISSFRTCNFHADTGQLHTQDPDTADHDPPALPLDRKSTRLNSSHVSISYAVF